MNPVRMFWKTQIFISLKFILAEKWEKKFPVINTYEYEKNYSVYRSCTDVDEYYGTEIWTTGQNTADGMEQLE